MSKKKDKTFDVWVRRDHYFSARIPGNTLEEALTNAKAMSIDDLLEAPSETIDSEHRITGVME